MNAVKTRNKSFRANKGIVKRKEKKLCYYDNIATEQPLYLIKTENSKFAVGITLRYAMLLTLA